MQWRSQLDKWGGGGHIHIFVFTDRKKKLIMQNTNIWICPPPHLMLFCKRSWCCSANCCSRVLDVVLQSTVHERDLGVWTSSNLTWSKYVEDQCAQSIKMLGYVMRSTLDIKIISVRRTLYWWPDILPKDTGHKNYLGSSYSVLVAGHFAERHFAERHFA